jgi:hypothetical protein
VVGRLLQLLKSLLHIAQAMDDAMASDLCSVFLLVVPQDLDCKKKKKKRFDNLNNFEKKFWFINKNLPSSQSMSE